MARKVHHTRRPSCAAFIVATIRRQRPSRPSMRPGAHAGIALHRIAAYACEIYREWQVRRTLIKLLETRTLLLTAHGEPVVGDDKEISPFTFGRTIRLERIPPHADLVSTIWYLRKGRAVDPERHPDVVFDEWLRDPLLYVIEDGLPAIVAGVCGPNGETPAERILAQM